MTHILARGIRGLGGEGFTRDEGGLELDEKKDKYEKMENRRLPKKTSTVVVLSGCILYFP